MQPLMPTQIGRNRKRPMALRAGMSYSNGKGTRVSTAIRGWSD